MFKVKENLLERFTQLVKGSKVALAPVGVMARCSSCIGSCGGACVGGCSGSCRGDCSGSCHRYSR